MVPVEEDQHLHKNQDSPLLDPCFANSSLWIRNVDPAQTKPEQAWSVSDVMPATDTASITLQLYPE